MRADIRGGALRLRSKFGTYVDLRQLSCTWALIVRRTFSCPWFCHSKPFAVPEARENSRMSCHDDLIDTEELVLSDTTGLPRYVELFTQICLRNL